MSSSKAARSKPTESIPSAPGSVLCGEIAAVAADGAFTVDFPGNELGPLRARTIREDLWLGAKVLLAFDGGDPTRPIVVGVLSDRLQAQGRTIHLKAARIHLQATDEFSIECGEAKVEAARDGKLKLKGRDVVSRASRSNKVQGSTVRLN